MRLGLVVQGPRLSSGRTGKTMNVGAGAVQGIDVVHWDCTLTVRELVIRCAKADIPVVVSGWKGDNWAQELKGLPALITESRLPDAPPHFNSHLGSFNDMRQAQSTLEGFLALQDCGVEVACKVRTDQLLDLNLLLAELRATSARDRILIPFISGNSVGDFFFGGKIEELIRAVSVWLALGRLRGPHADLAFALYSSRLKVRNEFPGLSALFAPGPAALRFQNIMEDFVVSVASQDLMNSIVWRGERVHFSGTKRPLILSAPPRHEEKLTATRLMIMGDGEWQVVFSLVTGQTLKDYRELLFFLAANVWYMFRRRVRNRLLSGAT